MRLSFRFDKAPSESDLASLWQYGCTGIWEQDGATLAYFEERFELPFAGQWQDADDTDYVGRYYKSLEPIYLDTLVVAPTHKDVSLNAGQKPLWLDPGMAFGSGHHETTFMALSALEQLDLKAKNVLDVGAGSGILTIAADLLGAATSHGVDNDSLTLPVAEANATLNRSRASFEISTLEQVKANWAHVLIANLYAELHCQLLDEYVRVLKKDGTLIVTGIMQEKGLMVENALKSTFNHLSSSEKNDWVLFEASL